MAQVKKSKFKICRVCGKVYPATTEFFHKNRGNLRTECKWCSKILRQKCLEKNKFVMPKPKKTLRQKFISLFRK